MKRRLTMRTKFTVWLFAALMCIGSSAALYQADAQGVRKLILGQLDATGVVQPVVQPCSTMGFSVEDSLTLPVAFQKGVFLRVNRDATVGSGGHGYVLVDGGGPTYLKLAVFNMDDMSLVGTTVIQAAVPGKYRLSGRYAGETFGASLYLGLAVRNGGGSCSGGAGNDCIGISKYTDNSLNGEGITSADATDSIDDMRFADSGNTLLMVSDNPSVALRRFSTFSATSLTLIGHGANTAFGQFGHLSQVLSGFNYAAFAVAANPNILKIASGANVSSGSGTVNTSLAGRLPAAIYTITGDDGNTYLIAESDTTGSAIANRGYLNLSTLTNSATGTYAASGQDGSAVFQSSFYDVYNDYTYVFRANAGSGLTGDLLRVKTGPTTFTVEERFSCGGTTCIQAGGASTGTQTADFADKMARLFVVNTDNPAVVSKIKVCATGGP